MDLPIFVKGSETLALTLLVFLFSCFKKYTTTQGNMEPGMYEEIEASRHKKDIEN